MEEILQTTDLDLIDRRILAELQRNGRASTVELSEHVHLSPAQCYRRQKRLEESGLIRDYVARVDAEKLGYKVVAFVSVTIANGPYKQPHKFQQAIAGIAEIQECHTVTGEADYLLKVVAPDLKSFSSFLMERLTKLFEITNTTSMVSLEELKHTTALPIGER
ncbi:MAG: Lrp/AsnC family transcriptional regulator [Burkholderiales bacterium]|nr:Lrp/AsnC family transcriptional regulator [Burkholderiales bacterium]